MKKIRNIRQLKIEQERLRNLEMDLEKEMQGSWQKLRKSIQPDNIIKDFVSERILNKLANRGINKLLQLFN